MNPQWSCPFLAGAIWVLNMILVISGAVKQPHIVVFIADDMGWSDVSWHGAPTITPALDSLFNAGIEIDQHYVMNTCTPTRGSLMTGKYAVRLGLQHDVIVPDGPWGLPLSERTLANHLKDLGYMVHGIGKWHLGYVTSDYTPCNRGFDSFYGLYNGALDYVTKRIGSPPPLLLSGYDFRYDTKDADGKIKDELLWDKDGTYNTYLYSDQIKRVITEHDKEKPLMLYVPAQSPHSPDQVPREYYDLYEGIVSDVKRRKNLAMVTAMDDNVKATVDSLKEEGMWENTVFVFFSDNGGEVIGDLGSGQFNYPLRGGKGTYWEGGIRSPAFISSPMITGGSKNTKMIHVVDWLPTLTHIAACGVDPAPECKGPAGTDIDGVNQWSAITGDAPSSRTEFLINIDHDYNQAAIRVGDYKLMRGHVGPGDRPAPPDSWDNDFVSDPTLDTLKGNFPFPLWAHNISSNKIRLFDVIKDPYEEQDISADNPAKVQELLKRIETYDQMLIAPLNAPSEGAALHPGGYWGVWQGDDPKYSVITKPVSGTGTFTGGLQVYLLVVAVIFQNLLFVTERF